MADVSVQPGKFSQLYRTRPTALCTTRTVIDIHFFFDSIIDILFFDSDYFDSILKNCTNRIFSHVPHYLCG